MNLERLLALLSTKSLHLSRVDQFDDPWEGTWPMEAIAPLLATEETTRLVDPEKFFTFLQRSYYVNCWHMREHESAALWGLYAGDAGIAIRTTVDRLRQALVGAQNAIIGEVEYIDFSGAIPGDFDLIRSPFLKRKSFEHEREVRVMKWIVPDGQPEVARVSAPTGVSMAVDLSGLIESIYVSPRMSRWAIPHLSELLARFDLPHVPVHRSELFDKRVY